eukprot:GEMP01074966.1.p1 GENE.GEMP01074966.1~~GEMP01074966.1.p1  ORF type:complete len:227 (+),score=35.84 GEMP01074966.1:268-948(+)
MSWLFLLGTRFVRFLKMSTEQQGALRSRLLYGRDQFECALWAHAHSKLHLMDRPVSTTLARLGAALSADILRDEWRRVLTWPYAVFRLRQHILHGKARNLPKIWDMDFSVGDGTPTERWRRFLATNWECPEIPEVRAAVDAIIVHERDRIFAHRLQEILNDAMDDELCVAVIGNLHLDNVSALVEHIDKNDAPQDPYPGDLFHCPPRSLWRRIQEAAILRRVKTAL